MTVYGPGVLCMMGTDCGFMGLVQRVGLASVIGALRRR